MDMPESSGEQENFGPKSTDGMEEKSIGVKSRDPKKNKWRR